MSKQQIHFFGDVNQKSVEIFRNMLLNAQKVPDVNELEILISSEGGDLGSGFSAYNYLRAVPMKTAIINMGSIESVAVILFLGAQERRAVKHTRFLVHSMHWNYPGGRVDANRVYEHGDSLQIDARRYADIFRERTAGAEKPLGVETALASTAQFLDVEAAFKAGILTTSDTSYPTLMAGSFFDRVCS